MRLIVRVDFKLYLTPALEMLLGGVEIINIIRWKSLRLKIKKDLGGVVVRQVVMDLLKALKVLWLGDLLRVKRVELEWEGVNKAF